MKYSRTIRTPDGREMVISSDDIDDFGLLLAEIMIEVAAEQGSEYAKVSEDEIARRVRAKGYNHVDSNDIETAIYRLKHYNVAVGVQE
jgi:hypothetical protein